MFGPKGPFCQSCGMPMSKDPQGGGTESNGAKSAEYCSHCYHQGSFTQPNITVEEMQQQVKQILKKMHFPGFLANYFTRDIPKLSRWSGR